MESMVGPTKSIYKSRNKEILRGNLEVVIKVISKDFQDNDPLRKGYSREKEMSKFVAHPYIARQIDVYEDDECLKVTYPCYPHRLREIINYATIYKIDVFKKIISTVYHLHSLSIVHLDLKESNILLDINYDPVIIDFDNMCFVGGYISNKDLLYDPEDGRGYIQPFLKGNDPFKIDIYYLGTTFKQFLYPGGKQSNVHASGIHLWNLLERMTSVNEHERPSIFDISRELNL